MVFYPAAYRLSPISQLIAGLFFGSLEMLANKDTPDSKTYPTPEDATDRMQTRGELFKLLNFGFGQRIANKMSAQIVNTLDDARATLNKFQR